MARHAAWWLLLLLCAAAPFQGVSGADTSVQRRRRSDASMETQGTISSMTSVLDRAVDAKGRGGLILKGGRGGAVEAKPWKKLGELTVSEANHNEATVYSMVSSGRWPSSALEEYEFMAATSGNVDSARQLMQGWGAPWMAMLLRGEEASALHVAVARNDTAAVEQLLKDGADVDERRADGTTPLITAASLGLEVMVTLLLDAGADVSATGDNGASALMIAASLGHDTVIQALLHHTHNHTRTHTQDDAIGIVNQRHKFAGATALHFAAEMGRASSVALLCALGADVEAQKLHGIRPLHVASDLGIHTCVRALVSPPCHANPDAQLMNDTTPLYMASRNAHVEVVRALLSAGADLDYAMPWGGAHNRGVVIGTRVGGGGKGGVHEEVNSQVANGATALHAAAEEGHVSVVELLVQHGAEPRDTMLGASPMHLAVMYHRTSVVRALLQHCCTPPRKQQQHTHQQHQQKDEDTTTSAASILSTSSDTPSDRDSAGEAEMRRRRRVLLESRTSWGGGTPLMYAVSSGQTRVVELLVQGGAEPEAQDHEGSTPLMVAAVTVRVCATYGSSPTHRPGPGGCGIPVDRPRRRREVPQKARRSTPLHAAAQGNHPHMVSLLLSHGAAADVNTPGPDGQTPLHLCVSHCGDTYRHTHTHTRGGAAGSCEQEQAEGRGGCGDVVQLLLASGADVTATVESTGATPLHMAARYNLPAMARMLLGARADANARALGEVMYGATPLLIAAQHGHAQVVHVLVVEGRADVDVGLSAPYHSTPLVAAVERGHLHVIKMLLTHGASVFSGPLSSTGGGALRTAVDVDNVHALKLLIEALRQRGFACVAGGCGGGGDGDRGIDGGSSSGGVGGVAAGSATRGACATSKNVGGAVADHMRCDPDPQPPPPTVHSEPHVCTEREGECESPQEEVLQVLRVLKGLTDLAKQRRQYDVVQVLSQALEHG